MNRELPDAQPDRKAGFTLLEVMIASSIMALVFAACISGFIQSARIQFMADRHYAASVIGRNRIEYAKVFTFQAVDTLAETNVCMLRDGTLTSTGDFWRTTLVQPSANNTNCMEVIVKVTYETKPGVTSEAPVEVMTMIGD